MNADAVRAAVREGLRRTGLTLRVQLGSNAERWQWGRLHPLHFEAFRLAGARLAGCRR